MPKVLLQQTGRVWRRLCEEPVDTGYIKSLDFGMLKLKVMVIIQMERQLDLQPWLQVQ